jgi:predicted permease
MYTFLQDLRYALRQFRRSPVFTLTALLTLALGIGATTAIFSLINAVMLRSLPVVDPSSLYRIGSGGECCVEGGLQDNWSLFSFALYQRLKAASPEFEQVAAFPAMSAQFSVRYGATDAPAKPLHGEFVTGNYFDMFGIRPFAGRVLTPADDQSSATPVAMLSYRAWQQSYGGNPSVIGSTFVVEGHPFTIVGISPPGFFGETLRSDPPEIWLPLQQEPLVQGKNSLLHHTSTNWLRAIGRIRPGASVVGLPARLTGVLRRWLTGESGLPAEYMPQIVHALPKQHIDVIAAGGGVGTMKENYASSLRILLTVCSLVLLIACANIANLLLARAMARRSNTSVRLALGASRARLTRQLLTESILLSVLGGAAGIAVAYLGVQIVLALAFHSASFVPISASPSLPVLAFAFALSLLTGVLFGTAPAWFASHTDPVEALRGANRSTGDSSSLPQKALLIFQATISVVLLAGAGMLTRSLNNLEHQNFGFTLDHRVTVLMNQPLASYTPQHLDSLYRALQERLARVPGIERASLALYTPFTDNWGDGIFVQGHPPPRLDEDTGSSWDRVSPGYFETVGQRLLRGRGITEQDNARSRPVAVVNEAFVRKFFKHEDSMGKHFGIDLVENAGNYEIVGIVRDAKYTDPDKPVRPMFFVPLAQRIDYKMEAMQMGETRSHFINGAVLVAHGDLGKLEPQLRKAFSEVDPNLTIINIQTMQQQVDMNFDQQRAVARLTGLFGMIALILAAVGLYGVTAYTVARRTSEIGVRIALGADRMNVVRLVLRGAFLQIVIGLAIGIPMAIGAGRLISSQLYDVRNWDPAALGFAVFSLGICALIATVIPAQRAASIDPMKALRTE